MSWLRQFVLIKICKYVRTHCQVALLIQFSSKWAIKCIFARRNSNRISTNGNKSEAIEMRILHRGGKGLHTGILFTPLSAERIPPRAAPLYYYRDIIGNKKMPWVKRPVLIIIKATWTSAAGAQIKELITCLCGARTTLSFVYVLIIRT
jgi:hypothetical protein